MCWARASWYVFPWIMENALRILRMRSHVHNFRHKVTQPSNVLRKFHSNYLLMFCSNLYTVQFTVYIYIYIYTYKYLCLSDVFCRQN